MQFDQLEVDGYVLVDDKPAWITGASSTEYGKLMPLIDFLVFENPNSTLTSRSKSITEYGWDDPWKSPQHLNRKLKDSSNNSKLFFSSSTLNGMQEALEKAGLLTETSIEREVACFYDGQKNQTLSCLYHLRNALCHGRFIVETPPQSDAWLICEDRSTQIVKKFSGKKLSARMVLKISTLEKWKKIITDGPARDEEGRD